MKIVMIRSVLASVYLVALAVTSPALAQREQASPEQRLERLERQVRQMQRSVFPKGSPADTAGFSDEPAATQSAVRTLAQRLDSLERQMSDLVRQGEENGNRLRQIEQGLSQLKSDQDSRIRAIEDRLAAAALVPAVEMPVTEVNGGAKPAVAKPPKQTGLTGNPAPSLTPADDPAEAAYTVGFKQWEAGQYDQAIATLRDFVAKYPGHRRASFANNLIGRAYFDKGDTASAVKAFVANYEGNPGGARAADSLYYLGLALAKLGRQAQACNAYSEFTSVYGSARPDLAALVTSARTEAGCS
jgi:TolA-binding protein